MDIDVEELSVCEVAADGSIILRAINSAGEAVALRLSMQDAGAIAMTLPQLVQSSMRQTYRDQTLRYVYPLSSWVIERASDQTSGIITLKTENGFGVSFTIKPNQQNELSEALATCSAGKSRVWQN